MNSEKKTLEMYGGLWGGLIPLLILIIVLIWLSVAGKGSPIGFWAGGWLAIAVGLSLLKQKGLLRLCHERVGDKTASSSLPLALCGVLKLMWRGLVEGLYGSV